MGETSRPIFLVDTGERAEHHILDRVTGGKNRVLGHVADPHTAAERARAAVGLLDTGEDLEQGGLAGAVRPDETGLVAFGEPEAQTLEEGAGAEGLADALTAQEERAGQRKLLRRRPGRPSARRP